MKVVQITKNDAPLLQKFLESAGSSLERFRYFSNRTFDVLKNHLLTVMILDDEENPLAYGHLDFEGGTVWMGNCVIETEIGKGYGNKITQLLLNYARDFNIEKIKVSSDDDNYPAINLYESFGFRQTEHKDNHRFYEWNLRLNPELYISTIAFKGKKVEEIIATAESKNYNIEFGSTLPYRHDMEFLFLNAPINKYIHNYFPAPEKPFVINLASRNEEIRKASVEHCIKGMHLSEEAAARFYSAHAGFCLDPLPEHLSTQLPVVKHIERILHWKSLKDSVKEILHETVHLNIRFLLENNVAAKENIYEDGTVPLLCCDPDEIAKLIEDIKDPRFGILLDTGHLKISSTALNFDLDAAIKKLKDNVRCIHHSDNNGVTDNNLPLAQDYWFLKYMNIFSQALHVLEVKSISTEEIDREMKLLRESIVIDVQV